MIKKMSELSRDIELKITMDNFTIEGIVFMEGSSSLKAILGKLNVTGLIRVEEDNFIISTDWFSISNSGVDKEYILVKYITRAREEGVGYIYIH